MSVQLYQGDCLELMKNIPDGSVDMVLTSPPYDNLRTYNGNIDQWNFEKFKLVSEELFRVTKPGGVVVWIVNDATIDRSETGTSFRQALYFKDIGFNLYDTMIYKKKNPPPKTHRRYEQAFEYMFVFSKGKPKAFNPIMVSCKRCGEQYHSTFYQDSQSETPSCAHTIKPIGAEKQHDNIWEYAVGSEKRGLKHPAISPVKLAEDQIVSWSNAEDCVLDPFMGSGSTGVACVNTGRNFIGIELDPGYFETAKRRIAEAEAAL